MVYGPHDPLGVTLVTLLIQGRTFPFGDVTPMLTKGVETNTYW